MSYKIDKEVPWHHNGLHCCLWVWAMTIVGRTVREWEGDPRLTLIGGGPAGISVRTACRPSTRTWLEHTANMIVLQVSLLRIIVGL